MPQVCKTCQHPERLRIEAQALEGVPINRIAKANGLSFETVSRHLKLHARRDLQKASESKNGKSGSALLERIHALADDAASVLTQAKEAGSLDAANGAIGQGIRALELIGRITGEVPTGGNTSINVALGVRMDVAQQSVQIVKDAQSIEPREVIERALRCIRAWNAANPDAQVSL